MFSTKYFFDPAEAEGFSAYLLINQHVQTADYLLELPIE
jgi:hypothetical protein